MSTIKKTARPTEGAYNDISVNFGRTVQFNLKSQRIKKEIDPATIATMWPPMTFLGLAVTLLGIANTINELEPRPATIAVFVRTSKK